MDERLTDTDAYHSRATQGVTGVGAAIIFLVVWVVFSVAGASTGTLKETVALEAWVGLLTMAPFIWSANIREHTNWLILVSFLPFQAGFVPVGTITLQRVSPAYLELTFAALIALFVVERVVSGARESKAKAVVVTPAGELGDEDGNDSSVIVVLGGVEGEEVKPVNWRMEPIKFLYAPVENRGFTFNGKNWQFMLIWAFAGCASGFLGGMTGTHGPPTIACYTTMKVSKDVTRATSAAILVTVMVARFVTYAINGLFVIKKPGLYGAAGACGIVGVAFGIWAQKFVNKDQFTRILLGILACGAVLMLYKGIVDL